MANTIGLNSLGLVAAAMLGLSVGGSACAADSPPTPYLIGGTAAPNISGLWLGTADGLPGATPRTPDGRSITTWAPWPPPLTPAYRKQADERIAAQKEGRAIGDTGALCRPFGMPRMLVSKNYPDEIVQTPGAVSIFIYNTFPFVIWTDGRPHPKDLKPSYNGHSTGYWVGDTLYVDTVGITATTPLDSPLRTPHSGKLHMQTTIRRVADDTLHVHVTLYDEDALTEPMVTTNIWRRKSGPAWAMLDDASCFENNRNSPDDTGATGFVKF